jgi:DNA-binding transcriptional LysR family regulator
MISGYPAMARLLARRPNITPAVHVAGWQAVAHQVTAREVDLGLAELSGVQEDDQVATELVGQHRGRIFCRPGHPVLAAGRVALPALLEFPWMALRIPAGLPRAVGCAGKIDALSGDFIPAITIDVPMQIADLLAGSDTLALASLALMERDLDAGNVAVVPTGKVAFQAGYGFIYLKDRSLTPATLAYMQEVRAVEKDIVEREEVLARRYGDTL